MTLTSRKARIAGFLYLIFAALGPFVLFYVPSTLVTSGNAAATTANIASHETLIRLGIVGDLAGGLMALLVSLALYWLFESVDKKLAALVVILGGLLPCAIYFMNSLNWVGALLLVHGDTVSQSFSGPQRDELVMLFMRLHHYGVVVSLVFAGLWLLPLGALVIKSGFLPRFLGIWLLLAGVSWLVQSVAAILVPRYEDIVDKVSFPFGLGEIAFLLWLLIMGAHERPARVRD